jgi:hypothetical protein
MANSAVKTIDIMWEEFVEKYDAMCVLSKMVDKETINPTQAERGNDVIYVRQNYHASTVSGLDISGETDMDVVSRAVPLAFTAPQNVKYSLDAKEMRDESVMRKQGEAAAARLAATVDTTLYNRAVDRATIVQLASGAFSWNLGQSAETALIQRGISVPQAKLLLNATDYQAVAADLGGKQYMADMSKGAYERSIVPSIANFQTHRTDNLKNLVIKGTVTGTTINGAQTFTPAALDANGFPLDNRQMTLTVAGANVANIKAGDVFTIGTAGTANAVNAVHMITKEDTGVQQTFRVLAVGGSGTSLTISPAIVATGPYQNVTTGAANSAAVTFVNNATKPANLFFTGDSIQLKYSRLHFPTDQGALVRTATTENGAPLTMSYFFNHLTGKTQFRFHTYFAAEAVDPEKIGIIVANQ